MKLTWYGHASFGIRAKNGTQIVTDPYDPETSGYKAFSEAADVVIMSSDNDSFHCNGHLVPKKPQGIVLNALDIAQQGGEQTSHGITFKAIEAMEHLQHREHDPDQNAMYRFAVDGLEIGHMGDVGNPFSAEQLDFFRDLDIFLVLAGGHPTIDLPILKGIVDEIKPRLIIPMHFRTLRYKPRNTFWISEFLSLFQDDEVDFACSSSISLDKADVPETSRVLILDHL